MANGPFGSIRVRDGPEGKIQAELIKFLRYREWFVKETVGSMYQSGFPDLYCSHSVWGARWIEVKNPLAYRFTPAQIQDFPKFCAHGAGIWVLTAATEEEYQKLNRPCNWTHYLF